LYLDQIKKTYVHVQADLVFLAILYLEAFGIGHKGFYLIISDNELNLDQITILMSMSKLI
jgi:hypothetical protein